MPTFSSVSHYKTQSSANIFLLLERLLPVTRGWDGPYSQMKFSLVSKESHISFNLLKSAKIQCWRSRQILFKSNYILYFLRPWWWWFLGLWSISYLCSSKAWWHKLATWAYWFLSSISYFPLWLRLYWWQKYVLVLTILLDRWMMDYRWKWYSKCVSSNMNKNIILGYLAIFPHFKIGWFRQTKNHNTVIICAFYRWKGLKCLAGRINKKVAK